MYSSAHLFEAELSEGRYGNDHLHFRHCEDHVLFKIRVSIAHEHYCPWTAQGFLSSVVRSDDKEWRLSN